MTKERGGRNHTRLSEVKLSKVSLAESLHVFINHKRNCGSKTPLLPTMSEP